MNKHPRIKTIFRYVGAALGSLVLGFGTLYTAGAQDVAWDMPNEYGETSVSGEADKIFAARLAANSDGRIVITNHFGGSLGYKSKDHWAAVEDSAVPIASTYTGVFTGFDPIFLLNNMPFMATNPTQSKALIDATLPYYAEAFAKGNQILLLTEPWSPVGIWSKRPDHVGQRHAGPEDKDLRQERNDHAEEHRGCRDPDELVRRGSGAFDEYHRGRANLRGRWAIGQFPGVP